MSCSYFGQYHRGASGIQSHCGYIYLIYNDKDTDIDTHRSKFGFVPLCLDNLGEKEKADEVVWDNTLATKI